jgi:hypothetical protein
VHIHFVVQPITRDEIHAHDRSLGPGLQAAMFESNVLPSGDEVESFCDRARQSFRERTL